MITTSKPEDLQQDQRTIEGTLANDEYSSDTEILEFLLEECPGFDPALLARLIREQRPVFDLEPLHNIDWSYYLLPNGIWSNQ